MIKPIFISGNKNKANYLSRMLGVKLEHQKIDLDEIQSTSLNEIVTHKVKQAYQIVGRPVLVEDVALYFDSLEGLPGPFVKFFVDVPNGLENMCRILDSFENRSARAECVFGYYDGVKLELFYGGLAGFIANLPRGEGGFGWDRIFCPEGYNGKTRAELSRDDDEKTYQTIKPFAVLKEFLLSK